MTAEEDGMKTAHDLDKMLAEHDARMNGGHAHGGWRLDRDRSPVAKGTPDEVEHRRTMVRDLHEQYYTIKEIADIVGASAHTVEADLDAMGLRVGRNAAGRGPKGRARRAELVLMMTDWEAGSTVQQIATKFDLNQSTVRDRLREMGADPNERRKAKNVPEMMRLYADGLSPPAIAERFGISSSTVRNYLTKAGVFEDRRVGPRSAAPTAMVTTNSLTEMARFADLVLTQDLRLVDLTEEEAQTWETACKTIAKAVSKVRRNMKGNQQ